VACLGAGCKREPAQAPVVIDTRTPAPEPAKAPAPAAPAKAQAPAAPARAEDDSAAQAAQAAPAEPARPTVCEVEIFGSIEPPKGVTWPKGKPLAAPIAVYVAQGDCLAKKARILGRVETVTPDNFFIEVFTGWGTDLTVCAAQEKAAGKPTTVYGKAEGLFHAEAQGEVVFDKVKVALKAQPAHTFPAVRPFDFGGEINEHAHPR
jgi:hypothetical protein